MADVVYELLAKIGVDSTGLQTGLDDAKRQVDGTSSNASKTWKKAAAVATAAFTTATAGVVKFGKNALQAGMEFDAMMSEVKAVSGASGEEFEQLREYALEMGRTTKFTATEAGEALLYMGYAGWKTDQMLAGLSGIMDLAAASGEDLGSVSDIVTDALTAFGLKAEDSAHFADVLAAAATNSNTTVGMLGEAFKYVAPVAGQLGYSTEDTAIALGLLASSGIKASMAGTTLRAIISKLADPSDDLAFYMDTLGISLSDTEGNMYSLMDLIGVFREKFAEIGNVDPHVFYVYGQNLDALEESYEAGTLSAEQYEQELEKLNKELEDQIQNPENAKAAQEIMAGIASEFGGLRGMAGLMTLIGATDEDIEKLSSSIYGASEAFALLEDGSVVPLNEALESGAKVIETYNGAANAMKEVMLDNLSGDVTRLKSAWEGFQISFSDKFAPEIRRVMPRIIEAVGRLTEKLADIDFSKLADGLATLAEKALGLVGYLIEHSDQIIGFIVTVTEKGAKLLNALFGSGVESKPEAYLQGYSAVAAKTEATMAKAELGDGRTLEEYAQNVNRWTAALEKAEQAYDSGAMSLDDYQEFVTAQDAAFVELANTLKGEGIKNANKWLKEFNADTENVEMNDAEFDAIRAAFGQIEQDASASAQATADTLGGLSDDANAWGYDMMSSMAAGVTSGANSSLIPAVAHVATAIWELLAHSEPEKGPLSDDSTWMPDMMHGFAEGIKKGAPEVQNAVKSAFDVKSYTGFSMGSVGGGGITINVNGARYEDEASLAERIAYEIRNIFDREEAAYA